MPNHPLGAVLNRLRTVLDPAEAQTTDRQLLQAFVAREEEAAFSELVRRHGPMIWGVCRRILGDAHAAEDAIQATFLVLVRRARSVPWRESLGGWLHGTARRVALRARRAAGVSRLIPAQSAGISRPLAGADPSEEAASRELRRVLDQELQGLPAKYRAPLVLCDLEGKTHEQAARELGWPKGLIAKRLSGGRERLRARLLRRGVVPAAGAAALFTVNEVTAAPSTALAAAAILASLGGATTKATALAKGVMQTMWLTKAKTTAVLILALTVMGATAGFGAYRAWARAAAPALAASPAAPAAEDKEAMPIDMAVVYHVGPAQGHYQTADTPEGAALVADRPEGLDDNLQLYFAAFEKGTLRSRPVPPVGPNLAILAVGPVLHSGEAPRSGDEAAAVSLKRHGEELHLEMAYAEGRIAGKAVPWRPLVQVPVDLAPGSYRLTVTWQARKSLPDGEALRDVAPNRFRGSVVVAEDRQQSKPVRVNGAEFRAFVQARIDAPAVGDERPVDLGLRVADVSDKPLIFPRYPGLKLTTADGKDVPGAGITPLWIADPETIVDAGKSKDLTPLYGSLRWT
ncbi:MAG TPA: sigma-70 family RNA polymerase sigma factor, partial [Gemmataceae bacterium]|nr:sigma-70 family RNA polymerase sigma factor [Gemmataceae bacterium]